MWASVCHSGWLLRGDGDGEGDSAGDGEVELVGLWSWLGC